METINVYCVMLQVFLSFFLSFFFWCELNVLIKAKVTINYDRKKCNKLQPLFKGILAVRSSIHIITSGAPL